jgi:N-acetyl-1-D-myo-inositol-2-amino-2-deoxy-alpha-D-glucopyranoside deacetylase
VITFGEDGLYWHADHIGVHERTYDALQSLGAAAPPLYYVTMPPGMMNGLVEAIAKSQLLTSSVWGIPPQAFGLAAKPASFTVDVRDWVPRKLEAIRCHRTQMNAGNPFATLGDAEAREWIGIEHFRRAPTASSGESVLELLGERLASS